MSSIFSLKSNKSANSSSASSFKDKDAPPKTTEIFTIPPDGVVPTKKWNYDEAQLKQIEELKKYTATIALPSSDAYYPWEQRFLADPGTHPRYMRAAKWKFEDAKKRIKGTMEWRREYKPELIDPAEMGKEAETGKIVLSGFDYDARPVMYLRPGRENTQTSPKQIQHMIYHLERAIDLMPPGQEQVTIVVDYKSATSNTQPSIGTGRKVLSILQNHYVERLGRGLVVNMPWWMNAFFAGISPLMDPITRDKIRFNPTLSELIPPSQLDYEFGGEYHLDFDHDVYWKTLTEFCHITPDGKRANSKGELWYPPSGNGIKAALDGLVPKEGAVATGEMVSQDHPSATSKPIGDVSTSGSPSGGATNTQEKPTTEAQKIVAAVSPELSKSGGEHSKEEKSLENGVAGLTVDETDKQKEGSNGNGTGGIPTPPTVETKPGAPVGDIAFDHPPSKKEKEEVKKSLEI